METSVTDNNNNQSTSHVSFGIYDILKTTKSKDDKEALQQDDNKDLHNDETNETFSIKSEPLEHCIDENNNEVTKDETKIENEEPTEPSEEPSTEDDKKKKTRTVFSRRQVFQLESTFESKRYLSSAERVHLAETLELTETQV